MATNYSEYINTGGSKKESDSDMGGDKATSSASSATSGNQFNGPGSGGSGASGHSDLILVGILAVSVAGLLGIIILARK